MINPAIALGIALALLILWNYGRERRYVAVLAAAFLTLAVSFGVQPVTAAYDLMTLRLISNALVPLGGCLLIHGTLGRYRARPPFAAMLGICAVGLSAFAWYLYVVPDITIRVYIMNFMAGALVLMLGAKLLAAPGKRTIDRMLAGFVMLWAAQFFVRTVAVVWYEGPYTQGPEFYASLYWITLTLSIATFLLIFSVLLIAAIALDIADELKAQSHTDALSGLLNRRGLEAQMAELVAAAQRNAVPLSLVLCDLDSFKSVNDRHGHMAGDRAIAAFARCLRAHLRGPHLSARIGGEEFAVVLPATPTAAARLFAEAVRAAYAGTAVDGIPSGDRLTASFGVAELGPREGIESLMRRADAALYQAKREGRDRVATALPERALCAAPAAQDRSAELSRTAVSGAVVRR